jgi:hypothetical protein
MRLIPATASRGTPLREGRLDSDAVLWKMAIRKNALSRYKPNAHRIRAAKIRAPASSFVLMEVPGTKDRKEGMELINLDLLTLRVAERASEAEREGENL